uniref:Uncharacterized protein n=1 Tax=Phlebotomus papatasi TaxID=29031 RepID=A0A1B0DL55_PHLPP
MRGILSEIASIFDPTGWLAPVVLRAKLIMQSLWKEKIGWDDKPSDTIHGFADAFTKAYAACIYKEFKKEEAKRACRSGSAAEDLGMQHEWKWYKECQFLRAGKSINMGTINTHDFEMNPKEEQPENNEQEVMSNNLQIESTDLPTRKPPESPPIKFTDFAEPKHSPGFITEPSTSPTPFIGSPNFPTVIEPVIVGLESSEEQCINPPRYNIRSPSQESHAKPSDEYSGKRKDNSAAFKFLLEYGRIK